MDSKKQRGRASYVVKIELLSLLYTGSYVQVFSWKNMKIPMWILLKIPRLTILSYYKEQT
jgi:hypothetical protein